MKIALIALYNSVPPTFGSATVTYNLFKNLPGETYLIQLKGNQKESESPEKNLVNIPEPKGGRIRKSIEMLKINKKIYKELLKINPEIIIFEGGSWSVYYWLLFLKLRKRFDKIIYHVHNVEYDLRKQKENFLIALLTKIGEGRLIRNSFKVFCVSDKDASCFKRIYGTKPYVLPNGIDISRTFKVSKKDQKEIKKKYNLGGKNILFMGMPGYKPNAEAIRILKENIMPHLTKKIEGIKLVLTGGKVDFKEDYLINPGIVPYPDLIKIMAACEVCVAPIISGSGTRLKILEYLAAEKPVVSTSKGAEGLNITNNKNIIIEDDLDNFWKRIHFLLKNKKYAEKMGKNGEKLVKENYDYKILAKNFYDQITDNF